MNNEKSVQKALVSKHLFNWWQREFEKLETEFVESIQPYAHVMDKQEALKIYNRTVTKIYKRFSKPLIKHIHDS
jgi:hypothetical protein